MFQKIILNVDNMFEKISNSYEFEDITKGRKGCTIADYSNNIPLVRTTTIYKNKTQQFNKYIYEIINEIKKTNNNILLNNALLEIYDNNYKKMKYHSDQLLDIKDNSFICVFSCYNNNYNRKLVIKNKNNGIINEIIMENNSVIIFDTKTNKEYLHKIVLQNNNESKWLGLTFRLSNTFIKFINKKPYIYSTELILANDEQKKEFFRLRKEENKNINYNYPLINYTISPGDLFNG